MVGEGREGREESVQCLEQLLRRHLVSPSSSVVRSSVRLVGVAAVALSWSISSSLCTGHRTKRRATTLLCRIAESVPSVPCSALALAMSTVTSFRARSLSSANVRSVSILYFSCFSFYFSFYFSSCFPFFLSLSLSLSFSLFHCPSTVQKKKKKEEKMLIKLLPLPALSLSLPLSPSFSLLPLLSLSPPPLSLSLPHALHALLFSLLLPPPTSDTSNIRKYTFEKKRRWWNCVMSHCFGTRRQSDQRLWPLV